ncbi:MAG TPA: hypothetical protein VFU36_11050 [Jatrophihabitans sp.]|nr:hypothetical protein [Jatrophihabitans sp.]
MWANEGLLDRLLIGIDGEDVGMVDNLEFSDATPASGAASGAAEPELTALLCGPLAFGPRLGGRIGTWWTAIGRRLRPDGDPAPNRIPIQLVRRISHRGVELAVPATELPNRRVFDWARSRVVDKIPGSGA